MRSLAAENRQEVSHSGKVTTKEGTATEDGKEVDHAQKVTDIGKGTARKLFPAKTKGQINK